MKNWTPPKIKVELFTANEYVAACKGLATGLTRSEYFWDWLYVIGNRGYVYKDGPADRRYISYYEDITNHSGDSWHVSAQAPTGWYTNKELWRNTWGESFYSSVDTFNVYVFESNGEKRAYIYNADYRTDFTPDAAHSFS